MSILILILLVANTLLVITHLGFRNLAENILVFFTVFYGIITGSLTILGFLNCATKTSLVVFLSIILIILTLLKLKRQQKFHLFVKYQKKKPDFYALCVGAFLLSWLINIVLLQRNLPPITTDGIYYHLPFSARWFQTGRLERIPIYFSDIAMSYYPLTGDLFYLMHFLIFASDIFVNLVQLPFALYAGCAIYLILRKFNVSKNSAIFASIFFIIIKPILKQVTLVFVDLMLVAFYFSTVYFLLSLHKKYGIILASINAGMLVGTKTLGLIFLIFSLPLLFFNKTKPKEKYWVYMMGLLFFVLTGFWWYIQCWILTGNPLYPAKISFLMFNLNGLYTFPEESLITKFRHFFQTILSPYEIDAPSEIFMFLTSVWLVGLTICRVNKKFCYFLFLPIIIILAYVFVFPTYYYQMRHLLIIYGFFCSSFAILFDKITDGYTQKFSDIAKFLFLIMFSHFSFSHPILTLMSLFLFLFIFPLLLGLFSQKEKIRKISIATSLITSTTLIFIFFSNIQFYKNTRMKVFEIFYGKQAEVWSFVDSYKPGQKKAIAYVGDFFIFPFYGKDLENFVYYQPVNRLEETLIHEYLIDKSEFFSPYDFKKLESLYRSSPDFKIWFEGLVKHRVQLLVIKKRSPEPFIEETWANLHPSIFCIIFENEIGKVYKFHHHQNQELP